MTDDAYTEAITAAEAITRAIEIPDHPNWAQVQEHAEWLRNLAAEEIARQEEN